MKQIHRILLPVIILCLFCTLLKSWVPITAHSWLYLVVGIVLVYSSSSCYLKSKSHLFFCTYITVVLFYYLIDYCPYYSRWVDIVIDYCIVAFPASLAMMLCSNQDITLNNRILAVFAIIILIASVGTVIAESIVPGAVRLTAPEEIEDPALIQFLERFGMSNYQLPHAIPVIIPAMVVGLKNRELRVLHRVLLSIVLVASLVIVLFSGATTAIFLSVFAILLSVVTKPGTLKRYVIGRFIPIVVLLLFFFLFSDYIGNSLIKIGTEMRSVEGVGYDVGTRMFELGDYLISGDEGADMEQRSDHYGLSLSSFWSNPLFGGGESGGHSVIYDLLGRYGFIGFLPWLLSLLALVRFTKKYIDRKYHVFYYEGLLMAVIMLFSKNMANMDMWFCVFVILPLLLLKYQEI